MNGRQESVNAPRENSVPHENCPTQAKTGLEWATSQPVEASLLQHQLKSSPCCHPEAAESFARRRTPNEGSMHLVLCVPLCPLWL